MAFDGLITKSVVSELKNSIVGAKVNKIFQPTKNEIILGLYNNGINYALDLCADSESCRICLTTHSKPNPKNALNFCMLLRKYLVGSRITNISSFDLERTVEIQFECYNELNDLVVRKLYIEIMSRQSNIILTNADNIIIDTLRHSESEYRELLPAHEYTFVPVNKISFINLKNFDEFINSFKSSSDVSLTQKLTNIFIGFSRPFITESLNRLNIDSSNYSDSDLEKLYNYMKSIISNLGTNNVSCRKISDKDFCLVLEKNDNNLNINFFIDDFYFYKEQEITFINSRNNLIKIISSNLKKIYKKLENINSKIKECENMDTYRLYGEILTANLYKLNSSYNIDKITLENYYDNSTITIPLDTSISIQKNIEKYFKKYNKLKNALNVVSEQKKETEKEIEYIESIVFSLQSAKNMNDINEIYEEISENVTIKKSIDQKTKTNTKKNKEKVSLNLESITVDGYTVYIGKNNLQNDYLSLKFAENNDIWFHTQKVHGSHVLLKTNGDTDIPEDILIKCARLAMENSKASNSSNVPVDYCFARYVKKASGAKPRNGYLYKL